MQREKKQPFLARKCGLGVPPVVRVGPGYPAGLPGRVIPVTGLGSDPKPAGFFGPGTQVPEYPAIRPNEYPGTQVPGYPFSTVSPLSACLIITPRSPSNTHATHGSAYFSHNIYQLLRMQLRRPSMIISISGRIPGYPSTRVPV